MSISLKINSPRQTENIFLSALQILLKVGIKIPGAERFTHRYVFSSFKQNGEIFCLDRSIVEWALGEAGKKIPVYDQPGTLCFPMDGEGGGERFISGLRKA